MKTTWEVWDIEKGEAVNSFDTSEAADAWLTDAGINGEVLESRNPWWAILNDFQAFLDTAPEWSDGDEIRALAQLQVERGFEILRAEEAPVNLLAGRMARCGCGKERLSTEAREHEAFFEYRGPEMINPPCAAEGCRGYVESVHQAINPHTGRPGVTDHAFVARTYEFDSFYCGCRGWD